jgi:hypothetical protein
MPIFFLFGAGVYLGLYFHVVALIPFSAIAAAAIIFTSSAHSSTDIARSLALIWMSVQGGYLVGLTARELTERTRARPKMSQSNRI